MGDDEEKQATWVMQVDKNLKMKATRFTDQYPAGGLICFADTHGMFAGKDRKATIHFVGTFRDADPELKNTVSETVNEMIEAAIENIKVSNLRVFSTSI